MARRPSPEPAERVLARAREALESGSNTPVHLAVLRALVDERAAVHRANPGLAVAASAAVEATFRQALAEVGVGEWESWSLKDYDAARYGPVFGVSDDGRNAGVIACAFLDSPKSKVLQRRGELTRETIGACIDAERMSAAGELLVGPEEYGRVYGAVAGRIPMSTNVGTVVLPRLYRPPPFATYARDATPDPTTALLAEARAALTPYLATREAPARPATVFVAFDGVLKSTSKVEVLKAVAAAIRSGEIGDASQHTLGLLQRSKTRDARAAKFAIDVAAAAGIREVRIEGRARFESQDQLLLPGLLAFFETRVVNNILAYADEHNVRIEPKNAIDPETASRTIWAGLIAARSMGAQLGKFGLFPLTLVQQSEAMRDVASMIGNWTATPAFYADRPIVATERIYENQESVAALESWLRDASNAGFSIVLIDAPDRTPRPAGRGRRPYHNDRGRRLIKRDSTDKIGIFELADVDRIRARASALGMRVMWAGGLDGRQVFELALRGEFAIFTTTATARRVPVRGRADPSLVARLQPTLNGVLGVKMVVEAGFLVGRAVARGDGTVRARLEAAAAPVIAALDAGTLATVADGPLFDALVALGQLLESAWDDHLSRRSD